MSRMFPAPSFRPQTPYHVVWLATDACTARCLHCSSNSARRSRDELATPEAKALFEQLAEAGVVDLGISGGEPLLRRDMLELIGHAKRQGLAVGVASNGAKLRPDRAAALAALGLDRLQLSLDGAEDAHDRLRRWPGLFRRVLASIETALAASLRVHLCCTINRLNADGLEDFVAFAATLGIRRLNLSRYVPTGRGSDWLDVGDAAWRGLIERCVALKAAYAGRLEIVTHLAQHVLVDADCQGMPGFAGCQAGRGQGCVTASGAVLPCVLLPIPVGNIRDAPFKEIWTASPMIAALQDRGRLQGACGACAVRERCGGCRAVAFARTGDVMAADPRCWIAQDQPESSFTQEERLWPCSKERTW